jgi:SAM-dependent methyltransferase
MTGEGESATPEDFWEEFYGDSGRVWSGRPNVSLVREAADLQPGTALDVGCGEGADAIWLAGRGWRVTGVDISQAALERAAAHAAEAGVADRVEWRRHDLGHDFPAGTFDLVTVHFLHSPVELPVERVLRSAAGAVAPGGTLLIAGHTGFPVWDEEPGDESGEPGEHDHHDVHFPTPEEVLKTSGVRDGLEDGRWRLETDDTMESEVARDGRRGVHRNYVLRLTRA